MYEKYFGFDTLPFSITPDPRFLYDTPSCREAMAGLRYGIEGRKGLIIITGEPGTGKTRLVKDYVRRAEGIIRTVFITTPKLTVTQLLRLVLNDLGIAPSTQDRGALTLQLKDYLFEQFKNQQVVALLVDEAQHLSNELLEELRLLSNLETNEHKLIQIVLVGQFELEERLDQPELRQVRQRVALRCRLDRLKDQEVYLYIQARLKTAGFNEKPLFDAKAVEKITQFSNGIPRLINVICDSALLNCYALSKKTISAEMIEEVARDLQLTARRPNQRVTANRRQGSKDDGWMFAEGERPLNSVSERPLTEEIQDVFIAGEQRRTGFHWRRRLVTFASGFVIGVLATASVGTILDSQSNRNYLSKTAARIWDQVSWRATVETGPVEQLALHEGRTKELNVQPEASAKSPIPSQPPEESSAGANPTPILEARRSDVSQAADAPNRFKEKPTVNYDMKNREATSTATKATGKNQVGVGRMSASSRLAIDIHKAIANRAITGVEVSVIDGTVFLSGRVASENHKILAAQAARNVPGVTYLRDQIIVNDDDAS